MAYALNPTNPLGTEDRAIGEPYMYAKIASVVTKIVTYFFSGDLKAWCLLFALIGLVISLIIKPIGSGMISNIICGMIGAILGGYLMLASGSFYGRIGVLVASFAGAVVFLMVKRAFASDAQR